MPSVRGPRRNGDNDTGQHIPMFSFSPPTEDAYLVLQAHAQRSPGYSYIPKFGRESQQDPGDHQKRRLGRWLLVACKEQLSCLAGRHLLATCLKCGTPKYYVLFSTNHQLIWSCLSIKPTVFLWSRISLLHTNRIHQRTECFGRTIYWYT